MLKHICAFTGDRFVSDFFFIVEKQKTNRMNWAKEIRNGKMGRDEVCIITRSELWVQRVVETMPPTPTPHRIFLNLIISLLFVHHNLHRMRCCTLKRVQTGLA